MYSAHGKERYASPPSSQEHLKRKGVYERPLNRDGELRDRPVQQDNRDARDRERAERYTERARDQDRGQGNERQRQRLSGPDDFPRRSTTGKGNYERSTRRSISPPPATFRNTYRRPRSRSLSRSRSPPAPVFGGETGKALPTYSSSARRATRLLRSPSPPSSAKSYFRSSKKDSDQGVYESQEAKSTRRYVCGRSGSRSGSVSPQRPLSRWELEERGHRTRVHQQARSKPIVRKGSPSFVLERMSRQRSRSRSFTPRSGDNSLSPSPITNSRRRQTEYLGRRGSFDTEGNQIQEQRNASHSWHPSSTLPGRRSSPSYNLAFDRSAPDLQGQRQDSRHMSMQQPPEMYFTTMQPRLEELASGERSPSIQGDQYRNQRIEHMNHRIQEIPQQQSSPIYDDRAPQIQAYLPASAPVYNQYNPSSPGTSFPPLPLFPMPPTQYAQQQQQSPVEHQQYLFEPRQLSMGIRAPPPGPKSSGVKGFRPIPGFSAVASAQSSNPSGVAQLRKYFPSEDSAPCTPLNGNNGHISDRVPGQDQYLDQRQQGELTGQGEPDSPQAPAYSPYTQGRDSARPDLPTPPRLAYYGDQAQGQAQQHHNQTARHSLAPPNQRYQQQNFYHQLSDPQYMHQQQRATIVLPTAHAPLFPSLGPLSSQPAHLPTQAPATPTTSAHSTLSSLPPPPSPAGSTTSGTGPAGLPPKPSFSITLPPFLPQKPNFAPASASMSASSTPTSSTLPLPSSLPAPPIHGHQSDSQTQSHMLTPGTMSLGAGGNSLQATSTHVQQPQLPQSPFLTGAAALPAKPNSAPTSTVTSPSKLSSEPYTAAAFNDMLASLPVTASDKISAPMSAVRPAGGMTELYERLAQVGEGTYGKVYKARNQENGGLVGLKRIRMEAEKDGFPVTSIREIKLLQSLNHENVVRLQEMMVSKGGRSSVDSLGYDEELTVFAV